MQYTPILTKTRTVPAAIAAARFAGFNGELTPAGARPFGVTEYAGGKAGDDVSLVVLGTAMVTAGVAFGRGAELAVGPDGKAVLAGAGAVRAIAVEAASGDGAITEILLVP